MNEYGETIPYNSSAAAFILLLNSSGTLHGLEAPRPLLGIPVPREVVENWPAPNYVNPQNKKSMLFGWELSLLLLAVIAVAGRVWVRCCGGLGISKSSNHKGSLIRQSSRTGSIEDEVGD